MPIRSVSLRVGEANVAFTYASAQAGLGEHLGWILGDIPRTGEIDRRPAAFANRDPTLSIDL